METDRLGDQMESGDSVQTTVFMEIEGRLRSAVTTMSVKEIEGKMQAEHLIPLDLDGDKIWVQAGCIEYIREGDHRRAQ